VIPHLASFSLAIDGRMPQRDRPLYAARSGHGLTLRLPASLVHLKLQLGIEVDPIPYRLCLTSATAPTSETVPSLEMMAAARDGEIDEHAVAAVDSRVNLETLELRVPWWLGGLADGAGESENVAAAPSRAASLAAAENHVGADAVVSREPWWLDDALWTRNELVEFDTETAADADATYVRKTGDESRRCRDPRDCVSLPALPRLRTLCLETSLGTPWNVTVLRRSAPSLTRLALGSVALNCLGGGDGGADDGGEKNCGGGDGDRGGWSTLERLSLVMAEVFPRPYPTS
jgi:hypothetical protein